MRPGYLRVWLSYSTANTIVSGSWYFKDKRLGFHINQNVVALLETIHFADVNRWDWVIFESDSAILVQTQLSMGHGDFKDKRLGFHINENVPYSRPFTLLMWTDEIGLFSNSTQLF
jgi:hypothetical protein